MLLSVTPSLEWQKILLEISNEMKCIASVAMLPIILYKIMCSMKMEGKYRLLSLGDTNIVLETQIGRRLIWSIIFVWDLKRDLKRNLPDEWICPYMRNIRQ